MVGRKVRAMDPGVPGQHKTMTVVAEFSDGLILEAPDGRLREVFWRDMNENQKRYFMEPEEEEDHEEEPARVPKLTGKRFKAMVNVIDNFSDHHRSCTHWVKVGSCDCGYTAAVEECGRLSL